MGDLWRAYAEIADEREKKIQQVAAYLKIHFQQNLGLAKNDFLIKSTADLIYWHILRPHFNQALPDFEPTENIIQAIRDHVDIEHCYLYAFKGMLYTEVLIAKRWCDSDRPEDSAQAEIPYNQRKRILSEIIQQNLDIHLDNHNLPPKAELIRVLTEVKQTLETNKPVLEDGFRYGWLSSLRQAIELLTHTLFTLGFGFHRLQMKGLVNISKTINDTRLEYVQSLYNENQRFDRLTGQNVESNSKKYSWMSFFKWPAIFSTLTGLSHQTGLLSFPKSQAVLRALGYVSTGWIFTGILSASIFIGMSVAQLLRNQFKRFSLEVFRNKTQPNNIEHITSGEQYAFEIGQAACQSTSSLLFSCISPTTILNPKAYYAGYAAEEAEDCADVAYKVKYKSTL